MPVIYDWDFRIAPQGAAFVKRGSSVAGSPSLTGLVQTGQIDAGHWAADLVRVAATESVGLKAFRVLQGKLGGGVNFIRVPVFDDGQRPFPIVAGVPITPVASTEYTDGARFTDGTGFLESSIDITMAADAPRGSTKIDVTVTNAGAIGGGEYFSIRDRLYIIRQVISSNGGAQSWWIWPRLRDNILDGETLNFDRPICLMRLTSQEADDLVVDWGAWAFPDMSFVEAF